MFREPDPALDLPPKARLDHRPDELHVESDGTGSASFDWACVLDTLIRAFEHNLRSALGYAVDVIGVRFLDADGRAVSGPAPAGLMLVGFTTHQ